jgi:hypothetical protein
MAYLNYLETPHRNPNKRKRGPKFRTQKKVVNENGPTNLNDSWFNNFSRFYAICRGTNGRVLLCANLPLYLLLHVSSNFCPKFGPHSTTSRISFLEIFLIKWILITNILE